MDPVLQHLGDVTIQRLDKPKNKTEQQNNEIPEKEQEEDKVESLSKLKRNLDRVLENQAKKMKMGQSKMTVNEKSKISGTVPSDEDLSEYDTESEFEYESELENEMAPIKREPSDLGVDNSGFLEDFVEDPFITNKTLPAVVIKTESDSADTEDYEYDIKEKLKEMGEISFETVKKGERPKKVESLNEDEVTVMPAKKPTDEDGITERKGAISSSMMRRNIREVMDEAKLDESTLAAQRQEVERLQRVQEQQKIIRDLQRQVAQERMQNKVLSLLQGGNLSKPGSSGARIGNTVLVKLPNGETKPLTKIGKRPFELVKVPKSTVVSQPNLPYQQQQQSMPSPPYPQHLMHQMQQQPQLRPPLKNFISMKRPSNSGQLTPSVSIAPVMKKPMQHLRPPSDSDSENEDFKYQKPLPKPKHKGPPVPTIDLSSDDDCIVVSETEETSEEAISEDDPANSGMHTNDEFNQPDDQGRVIINIGHPEGEMDIFLAPQIARIIKPHQIGGVRFLYDNVVESVNRFDTSTGFGCILAHSMGLGKTLQVVCFSDIFLRYTSAKTILCIMPINTLQNWLAEYNMWLPTAEAVANSPLNTYGDVRPRTFNLHVLNDSHKTLATRAKVVQAWKSGGGVLLMGYEQYRLLSLRKQPKSRRKPHLIQPEDENKNKKLFDDIHEALVMPGPDLVICDEGHRIKNSHASISLALKQMRTKRRVVLTGYPLQNNLMEYWCMVDFVRPNYLGSKTEFCNMFERPIQNGQCIDSTEADIKLMRYRAHVLHSLLVGFVQRRSHEVLQTALPQKEEHILLLRMTPFQRKLYDTFMNEVVRSQSVPNPLKAFAVCCKIWNHPDVLYNFLKKKAGGETVDIDLEEVANNSGNIAAETTTRGKPKRSSRKSTAKSKKNDKPAASITPYSSTSVPDLTTSQSQQPLTNSLSQTNASQKQEPYNYFPTPPQSHHSASNASFDNQFSNDTELSHSQYTNQQQTTVSYQNNPSFSNTPPFCNQQPPVNYQASTPKNTTQKNYPNQDFQEKSSNNNNFNNFLPLPQNNSNNFENYQSPQQQQNYWNQQESKDLYNNYNSQNFNQASHTSDMFNNTNSCDSNQWVKKDGDLKPSQPLLSTQWIKKENEMKPINSNNIITNSGRCDSTGVGSFSDNKPKINIISDIKIGSPYSNFVSKPISEGKKINIISDIKLDIKKEEPGEEKSKFNFENITNEIKLPSVGFKSPLTDDEELKIISDMPPPSKGKEDFLKIKEEGQDGIPYDWAIELLKDYVPGCIENSGKMEVLFCIIRESIALSDRLLLFSQSLITLDLIEQFLQMNNVPGQSEKWAKNTNYYRLDGSTSALEREKLINEFNSNSRIYLFLVSTRAGSLGINLIGANRVVVLDASWNPCHDTQAVCRVYRYGQRKPCFVYRLVMDHCLEKKIYDRQINKQGMSDRVVDECNPDAHLTMKDVSTLCFDDTTEGEQKDWSVVKGDYIDVVLQKVLELYGNRLNKPPFQHESLLVDRKDKQLSKQEKRLAKKGYEREKQAARQPSYSLAAAARSHRPIASVRPMQQGGERPTRWIPAEHWQRQGMTAQEMTLPLDVVIPTNQPDKSNIILKAGQKVLVLKSPKGVYMQLENGKIVAIKTAIKMRGKAEEDVGKIMKSNYQPPALKGPPGLPLLPPKRMVRPFSPSHPKLNMRSTRQAVPNLVSRMQGAVRKSHTAKTKPYQIDAELDKLMNRSKIEIDNLEELEDRTKSLLPHSKARSLPNDISQRLLSDEITMERHSLKNERNVVQKSQAKSETAQLKVYQLDVPNQKSHTRNSGCTIQQLEQSTSALITETKQRIQDISDISNTYPEEDKLQNTSDSSSITQIESDCLQDLDTAEDVDDLDQTYPEETHETQTSATTMQIPPEAIKSEVPNQDYNYNGYYGYNMQQYHPSHPPPPPPHQAYNAYPHQPPPYDYNYPHQQPQYNYGVYPQNYPPQYPLPPPQAPPYDYGPHPPPSQPIYPYHSPYPQQYHHPPPNPYPPTNQPPPPPPPPHNYGDFPYNSTPLPQNPPPPTNTSYYPNV